MKSKLANEFQNKIYIKVNQEQRILHSEIFALAIILMSRKWLEVVILSFKEKI